MMEMEAGSKGAPVEVAVNLRRYKAHITSVDTMLNLRQVPHLLDDGQFAVAIQMAAGEQLHEMEELSADIELALDRTGCGQAAQMVAVLDFQARDLWDELNRLWEDMEPRRGPEASLLNKCVWFYLYYIYAKAALTAIQEVQYEFLAGEHPREMVSITEQVIVHMASASWGSDEAIDKIDSTEVPVNPVTESMRAEIKECVATMFQILDLMHRVK